MSTRHIHSILQETVEEEIPAGSVDLWPRIDRKIQDKRAGAPKRRPAMRLVYTAVIVLILAVVVFLLTPQGRSLAHSLVQQYLLQYFKRADYNFYDISPEALATVTAQAGMRATQTQYAAEHPELPRATATVTATPEPGTYMAATQSVPDIEAQLGFDVLEPGWLPERFGYTSGASADLEMGIAYQFYGVAVVSNGLTIKQYPANLELDTLEIGTRANVVIVDINGHRGEYTWGTWMSSNNKWVWRADPYIQWLRWEQDGMRFEFMYFGPRDYMSMEEMVAVAESMH